jgi:hypothetical protein
MHMTASVCVNLPVINLQSRCGEACKEVHRMACHQRVCSNMQHKHLSSTMGEDSTRISSMRTQPCNSRTCREKECHDGRVERVG